MSSNPRQPSGFDQHGHHTSAPPRPVHLDVDRQRGLTVQWSNGIERFYPVAFLRRMSPSADARELREQIARNPLTVLPASAVRKDDAPLSITDVEPVGNYAVRLVFSDGHGTGLYSWQYLWELGAHSASSPEETGR